MIINEINAKIQHNLNNIAYFKLMLNNIYGLNHSVKHSVYFDIMNNIRKLKLENYKLQQNALRLKKIEVLLGK